MYIIIYIKNYIYKYNILYIYIELYYACSIFICNIYLKYFFP